MRTIPILPRSTGCDRDQLLDALDAAADDRDVVIEHGRERGGLLAQLREANPPARLHALTDELDLDLTCDRERPQQRVLVADVDRIETDIPPSHAVLDRRLVCGRSDEDLDDVDGDGGPLHVDRADVRRVGTVGECGRVRGWLSRCRRPRSHERCGGRRGRGGARRGWSGYDGWAWFCPRRG